MLKSPTVNAGVVCLRTILKFLSLLILVTC
jgi:hypothetical protein